MQENYELVQKGFRILHPAMAGYIGREMSRAYKDHWWEEVRDALSDQLADLPYDGEYGELIDSLDIANCLRLIDRRWNEVFRVKMSMDNRSWAKELMGVRNRTAHIGSEDFTQSYAERALDTMSLLCEAFDEESTREIRDLYRMLRNGTAADPATSPDRTVWAQIEQQQKNEGVLQRPVGAGRNLPSWRDVMRPHPDVAEGRYVKAEFAADLAQVARGDGAMEYLDPVEFFSRTYITEGMTRLLVVALQRITGRGGEPVIQLKTAFGGGKTHSMLALYHMVRGEASIERIPALKPVLERAGLSALPKANVAVLVGTALDPSKRKNPAALPKYTVNTLWGEMAFQLVTSVGRPELYSLISEADRKGVSPGSESLTHLLDACGPCVILLDELVAYAKKIYGHDNLPAGTFDNFITFIQEITEAARASKNSIIVASIPESEREIGGEAGQLALEMIEHTFGRMESVWKPVAANEGFEVVRRRLFLNCENEAARDAVCDAFSRMYLDNPTDFPRETKELEYRNRMAACYPIHPEVFDRLYGDWATLEQFQRTRGVLRLMAAVIHELWMANDASAMIMPGSIPMDIPNVRDELTRYLSDAWNGIIDREVDGKNSIPYQKDKETVRYGQKLAARRVARTILLGSAPTTRDQTVRGIESARIRLGVVQPGESIADFNDALNTLHGALSFLYSNQNGDRHWYDTRPTLRKRMEDKASQYSSEAVNEEIEKRLNKIRKENYFAGVHACPNSSQDVPDERTARLVIMRPQYAYSQKGKSGAIDACEEILNHRGTSPRIYRNMLAFVAPDARNLDSLQQEVRRFLAWTSILTEKEELNLDAAQIRETENNLRRSNETVELRIKETWCWLLVPSIDVEDIRNIQWETYNIGGGADSIPAKANKEMVRNEQLILKWAPSLLQMILDELLWKDQDDIQIKKLWDYLCTYCYLPRLKDFSVLEQAILSGLDSDEFFGLASSYANDRYVNLKFNKLVPSLNETDLLVKPNAVRKQIAAEQEEKGPAQGSGNQPDPSGTTNTGSGSAGETNGTTHTTETTTPHNRHFFMSVQLDNTRINRDVNTYVEEVIQHLMSVGNSRVTIKLDVDVEVPDGIPNATVRTVTENCRTLKVDDFGFDE